MPWPLLAVAVAGLALSTAQTGAQVAGGIGAKKRADKANRLRKKLLERTHREDKLQFEKQLEGILGTQRAIYGQAGVDVEAGTPAFIRQETEEAGQRARRNLAYSYVYERKTGGTAGRMGTGYFSGLSNMASSAYQVATVKGK